MSNKKKEFFLVRWFKRCVLGDRAELSTEEEERIQTPMRAMLSSFPPSAANRFSTASERVSATRPRSRHPAAFSLRRSSSGGGAS